MNTMEIAAEAAQLPAQERKKIIARLVMVNLREDQDAWNEVQRRMNDDDPNNWVSLDEVKAKFLAPGMD